MSRRVLIAGIGNVFLSDDGFGVEVAHALCGRPLPSDVTAADYGIRGLHLAYELLDGYDALVLADAVPAGEEPGTLVVLEPDAPADDAPLLDAHSMSPDLVLATLARLGGSLAHTVVVGCQPSVVTEGMGLSPPVRAAVPRAAALCLELAADLARPIDTLDTVERGSP